MIARSRTRAWPTALPLHVVCLAAIIALAIVPRSLAAQLVRGVVRDSTTGAPLAGVVVAIERADEGGSGDASAPLSRVGATLTNTSGRYELATRGAGRFVVTAKRIGVRQFQSPPFTLETGETRAIDISLEGVRYGLPSVTVSAATPCRSRQTGRDRIAALWAEASTALTASELTQREQLVRSTILRYERQLDPTSLTVRSESRQERRSTTERAFVSFPAESLAVVGYARTFADGTIEHFAPDAEVLLSDEFVRDHCFGLASQEGSEVGLTFSPVGGRRQTDIEGTLWLDAKSYELRRVAFRYTNFPLPVNDARVGGEVHFARVENGGWYVSRWFMRVPRIQVRRSVGVALNRQTVGEDQWSLAGFKEVGGSVSPDGQRSAVKLAILRGRALDSTGQRGLAGAQVRLVGTTLSAPTRSEGSFRLDSIPAGNYTLLVEHPSYAELGLAVIEQELEIDEGSASMTVVKAIGTDQILRQLCGYYAVPDSASAMRFVLPSAPDDADLQEATLRLSWSSFSANRVAVGSRGLELQLPVDAAGGATACALPKEAKLRIEQLAPDGTVQRQWETMTPVSGFAIARLSDGS